MDCSPPGSSVQGIFPARRLEWIAISSSRGSSQPQDQIVFLASPAFAGGFFAIAPLGKPISLICQIEKNDTDEHSGKAETQSQL